jgi:glyoxylase I family protein
MRPVLRNGPFGSLNTELCPASSAQYSGDMLTGIHHVSINVADLAACEPFYLDVLGMKKLDRPAFAFPGLWLEAANGIQVHLMEVADWVPPRSPHYAFAVDDIDSACAQLRDAGVKVTNPSEIPDTGRQAFFKDPAGNRIEINQSH